MNPALKDFLHACREQVDSQLKTLLADKHSRLYDAMRYSLLNGGKRIRPGLCYAAADLMGSRTTATDLAACSVEMIHAYSLIHDDLPAMDDDDLRRGKPTCHIAFDEASAILAGDALQALAFRTLASIPDISPTQSLHLIRLLADAAGADGMVGGQSSDLTAVNGSLSLRDLEQMHRRKTGALISASVMLGALSAGDINEPELAALNRYGHAIGLAFQVQDDILDEESNTETLGKRQGADRYHNKPTYTSLLGLKGARGRLEELHHEALGALSELGERASLLRLLADYIVTRDH